MNCCDLLLTGIQFVCSVLLRLDQKSKNLCKINRRLFWLSIECSGIRISLNLNNKHFKPKAYFFFGKPDTVKLGDSVTSMSAREKSVNHCDFMLKGRHQRTKDHNFNFFWWSVVSQAKIWLNLFIIPSQLDCKVVLPV